MDINKAIKKQNKSLRRFVLLMSFIFLFLPLMTLKFKTFNLYIIIYLVIIETVILSSVFIKTNNEYLIFGDKKYKIIIKSGLFNHKIHLICDRVVLVHAIRIQKDFHLVIILKSRFRNKKIKPMDANFFSKYNELKDEFNKIKRQHPAEEYFYFAVKKGGVKKNNLLLLIYKSCVYAYFTDETIRKIKEWTK